MGRPTSRNSLDDERKLAQPRDTGSQETAQLAVGGPETECVLRSAAALGAWSGWRLQSPTRGPGRIADNPHFPAEVTTLCQDTSYRGRRAVASSAVAARAVMAASAPMKEAEMNFVACNAVGYCR
jgi:hypothetical protein